MRPVSIIGIGQTDVGELWNLSARQLAYHAISAAMTDAGVDHADALFLGNMLSGSLLDQEHMGSLVADFCGLHGIEAAKVEAACASGAAALACRHHGGSQRLSRYRHCSGCGKDDRYGGQGHNRRTGDSSRRRI